MNLLMRFPVVPGTVPDLAGEAGGQVPWALLPTWGLVCNLLPSFSLGARAPCALDSSVFLPSRHPRRLHARESSCSLVHGTKSQETSQVAGPSEPHCWVWSCRCAVVPARPLSLRGPGVPSAACLVWLRAHLVGWHLLCLPRGPVPLGAPRCSAYSSVG